MDESSEQEKPPSHLGILKPQAISYHFLHASENRESNISKQVSESRYLADSSLQRWVPNALRFGVHQGQSSNRGFPIEMGIYWSWSVWFLALNLETPTKLLEFLVTACFPMYEHVIYVTNCNNIPTKICHVSPKKKAKQSYGRWTFWILSIGSIQATCVFLYFRILGTFAVTDLIFEKP